MSASDADLSPLQRRILGLLSDVEGWTLTGGAALTLRAHHRETRDLDLFWYGTETITRLAEAVRDRLRTVDELQLETMQTSPRFVRLRVSKENTTTLVDLVASPGEPLGPPDEIEVEGQTIRVDAEQELLTTKLCALLGRSELRDLWDTKVLLERGASLERALEAAPRQDAGFSIPTFAWILESLDVEMLAVGIGLAAEQAGRLDAFKEELTKRVLRISAPDR